MDLLLEELNWIREEGRRLDRVEVGKICGCKSCLCCEELKRDTEQRKMKQAINKLVLTRRI
jgi:hypothetical protein